MNTKAQIKQKAYQYYCKGLNSKEIAKLLNLSYRTVQGYMQKGNWKQKRNPDPIKIIAYNLYKLELSKKKIAETLNISLSTVQNWSKQFNR